LYFKGIRHAQEHSDPDGSRVFLAITVGGMLYLLPIDLEVALLYGGSNIGSDTTNVGYPP
jgi:hypothetical protein